MGLDWVWPWVFRRVWLRFCVTKRERERERHTHTHTHTQWACGGLAMDFVG